MPTRAALVAAAVAAAIGVCTGPSAVAARTSLTRTGRAGSANGLDVLPFPGTPDASPGTNIDFPAVSPAQIEAVKVVGSRSGVHGGLLRAQPDHQGAAFSPDRPFADGERVSVTATLRSAAAGTASGAPGARSLKFSFSVQRPATLTPDQMAAPDADAVPSSSGGSMHQAPPSATHSFVTQPGFHVPWIRITGKHSDSRSGDIFLDAGSSGQHAAYMLNPRGDVVWYHPSASRGRGPLIVNTRVQMYKAHPVITYWQGRVSCPPCAGEDGRGLILNSSYRTIHTVTAGDGYESQGLDLHEFVLTPHGTAFAELWTPVHANLTSVGGPTDGTVFDWIIQEIDVATNKVVWEWHALGHVPIASTHARYVPGQPLDYFHLNSIQQLPDGHVLISARDTWTVYSIDKKTGKVAWRLGGKNSSFRMGRGTQFYWQHDAQLHGNGLLTLFDDGASPAEQKQSRALEIHLGKHRATLVHAYVHRPSTLADSEGSAELLPNRDVFVGWGDRPYFSEYTPGGRQIFGGSFDAPIASYRALRDRWTGHPTWSPGIAVRKTSKANRYTVYASWNGATEVAHWRVLVGKSKSGSFRRVKSAAWSSFETRIRVATHDAYFEVQALGAHGKVLRGGTSRTVRAA